MKLSFKGELHPATVGGSPTTMAGRIRDALDEPDLDCTCRERLKDKLRGIEDSQNRLRARNMLSRARDHRDRIVALLELLSEIDEITEDEPDRTVIPELAGLFEDIVGAAESGAAVLEALAAAGTD